MTKKIEIYSGDYCPYCKRAKALLDNKGFDYTEYDITSDDKLLDEMLERTGGAKSIPQIFIDGEHIGGCDDLHALDAKGGL